MIFLFFKDSLIYFISGFLSRGLSFILIPLYTHVLEPADFGSLDLFMAFASIVNVTIALEVSQGVARFFGAETDPDKKIAYTSSAFWFTFGCYSIFCLLMIAASPLVATFIMGQAGFELEFKIGVIYVWSNGLFYLIQNQFRWELRSKEYAVVSFMMAFVTALVSIWLTYFENLGLVGLLTGMLVGCVSATLLGCWWLRANIRVRFDLMRLKEMLSFSAPLVFSGIAVWLGFYIDRIMINYLLSIDEVGLYGIGYRLASIAGLVMLGFRSALVPIIYAHYQKSDTPRQIEQIFRSFLCCAMVIFLILTLFSKEILELIAGPAFYGGSSVVVFLVPAVFFGNMYIFSPGIGIAKKTYLIVWINVGGGLLNVLLNWLLIPELGMVGASVATMLSSILVWISYTVIGQRFYPIPHNWLKVFSAFALVGMLAAILPQMSQSEVLPWELRVAAIIIFVAALFLLGLIRRSEMLAIWKILRSRVSVA